MTTENNIQKLLKYHTPNTVCLVSWLQELGISQDLQTHYRRSGWLESVQRGALKRPNETIEWLGAVFTLQTQAHLPIHAGALTALELQGNAHYLRIGEQTVFLFAPLQTLLPSWFKNHDWGDTVQFVKSSFLDNEMGMTAYKYTTFSIQISSPERAILEALYLAPKHLDLRDLYDVFEGLTTLRPLLLQTLLESCSSIKVKRLFFFMADKANHGWNGYINRSKINLGKGSRSLVKQGCYDATYQLMLPVELFDS